MKNKWIKKLIYVLCMVVALSVCACSKDEGKESENNQAENKEVELETTQKPEEPDETQTPATDTPTTSDPNEENSKEETDKLEKYKYINTYKILGDLTEVDYEKCENLIKKRIELMQYTEIEVDRKEDIIRIGYNNGGYSQRLALILNPGKLVFRYKEDFDVFSNDQIEKIEIGTGFDYEYVMNILLTSEYVEEFAKFTKGHIGGELYLFCDGEKLMMITIDMQVPNGQFSIVMPDQMVFDMMPMYIQSGVMTYELELVEQ